MNGTGEAYCPVCKTGFYHTCEGSFACAKGMCPVLHHCDAKETLGRLANSPAIREGVSGAIDMLKGFWSEFVEDRTGGADGDSSEPVRTQTIDVQGESVGAPAPRSIQSYRDQANAESAARVAARESPAAPSVKPGGAAFCEECGRVQTPTAKFCAGCGSKVQS